MKIVGIIAEYNPFHYGHLYQINKAKEQTGADLAVAVMSGNYVQRGDVAIFEKRLRAKSAILNGIDLVLELPSFFAVQSAEIFAEKAVFILNSLNCMNFLAFGTECDNFEKIFKIAELLSKESEDFKKLLKFKTNGGISFPSARAQAVNEMYGKEYSDILSFPNNILGIEYIKAIINQRSRIKPVSINRHMVGHNEQTSNGEFASATYIRNIIKTQGIKEGLKFIPESVHELFEDTKIYNIKKAEIAIIANLRKMKPNDIAMIPDVAEGLENRISRSAFEHYTIDELINDVKTKRYTHARLRRIVLRSFLGIDNNNQPRDPLYIKILDFNENGQKILNYIKKSTSLPIVKNMTQVKKIGNATAEIFWKNELLFDSLYELF